MKKILIALIAYGFILLNGRIFTVHSFKNKIYAVDGFAMELYIYNNDAEFSKKLSLKNISKNAVFDFFAPYDDFNIYLADSNMDMVYLLDKNFALKKSIDIKNKHNIEIYRKIFPSEYNGLIISSKDKNEIFKLRNNRLTKIISSEREFYDVFADKDFIYLLFKSTISVYSHTGIHVKQIAVPMSRDYTDFIINDSRIYLKSKNLITSVNRNNRKIFNREINGIAAFTAADSSLYYFSGDTLKLIRIDL